MAIASVMFNIPIFASLLRWLGCVEADGKVMSKVLETGQCFVLPDGIVGDCFLFCFALFFFDFVSHHFSRCIPFFKNGGTHLFETTKRIRQDSH